MKKINCIMFIMFMIIFISSFSVKVMKKINCIMFIMFMIIFISSFSVKATVNNTTTYKYKEFFYIYRGENIQIIDYYGKKSKVIVPSEIEGRKVVKFGYNYSKDKKYLKIKNIMRITLIR